MDDVRTSRIIYDFYLSVRASNYDIFLFLHLMGFTNLPTAEHTTLLCVRYAYRIWTASLYDRSNCASKTTSRLPDIT